MTQQEREREREREISSCNKLNNDVPCYNLIVLFEIDLSKQIEREREKETILTQQCVFKENTRKGGCLLLSEIFLAIYRCALHARCRTRKGEGLIRFNN